MIWLNKLRRFAAGRRAARVREVRCDESGIRIGTAREQAVDWGQITAAYAYKRDCYAVDQIRLVLWNEAKGSGLEVTENDQGYEALLGELERRLSGFPSLAEWCFVVAMPPVETQWARLYPWVPAGESERTLTSAR